MEACSMGHWVAGYSTQTGSRNTQGGKYRILPRQPKKQYFFPHYGGGQIRVALSLCAKGESGIPAFELPSFLRVILIQGRHRDPSDTVFPSLSHGTEQLGLKPSKKHIQWPYLIFGWIVEFRSWQMFLVESRIHRVNILSFPGPTISPLSPPLHSYSPEAGIIQTWRNIWGFKKDFFFNWNLYLIYFHTLQNIIFFFKWKHGKIWKPSLGYRFGLYKNRFGLRAMVHWSLIPDLSETLGWTWEIATG